MTSPTGSGSSDELLRLLIENVRDYAIFMLDTDGQVLTWNLGAERLKGWSADEIVGQHFSAFYTAEDQAGGKPARALRTAAEHGTYREEGERVRKDGSRFIADVLITAVRDEHRVLRGFAKITRDISERKEVELQLRRAFEELEQASRVKDEFLTTMSHELRTPMTSIIGWASLLAMSADPASVSAGVRSILESAQLQAKLIDDLMDVASSLTGKLNVDLGPVDFAEVVRNTVDGTRPVAAGKRIDIELDMSPAPVIVIGDRFRLQQIVWNLLSNALKFTQNGGTVTVSVLTDQQGAELRIADTGRGMDEETLRHIFRRFWQGESSTTRSAGGMGIGLALTRHLVELHGGEVRGESAGLDLGSTFRVTLPLAPAGTHPDEHSSDRAALRGTLVLLLEDDPASRLVLAKMVEQHGAEVIPVGTVEEGLRVLEEKMPDVILSDIAMPEQDGFAFIQQLRQHAKASGVPAIAITAVYLRPEEREKILAAGFDGYLRKPVLPAELTDTLLHARHETK